MTQYRHFPPARMEEKNGMEVDRILFVLGNVNFFPNEFDFVIREDGSVFASEEFIEKGSLTLKIFLQISEEEENSSEKKREIFSSFFSRDSEDNPSVRAKTPAAKRCSYLVSKILRVSDFSGGEMRLPMTEENGYISSMSDNVFLVERECK